MYQIDLGSNLDVLGFSLLMLFHSDLGLRLALSIEHNENCIVLLRSFSLNTTCPFGTSTTNLVNKRRIATLEMKLYGDKGNAMPTEDSDCE